MCDVRVCRDSGAEKKMRSNIINNNNIDERKLNNNDSSVVMLFAFSAFLGQLTSSLLGKFLNSSNFLCNIFCQAQGQR